MGRASGGYQPRRGIHLPFTRIVPDNSEITALICYIDVVIIDGCSQLCYNPRRRLGRVSKKRGNGEVSITKRKDGRWEARYTIHTSAGPKRRNLYGRTRLQEPGDAPESQRRRAGGTWPLGESAGVAGGAPASQAQYPHLPQNRSASPRA